MKVISKNILFIAIPVLAVITTKINLEQIQFIEYFSKKFSSKLGAQCFLKINFLSAFTIY